MQLPAAIVVSLAMFFGARVDAADAKRPVTFPHRIWAACDFEGRTPDYAWFGAPETNDIPKYAGNRTALRATAAPYEKVAAIMAGINPVPGPRMGKENSLFIRYFLVGDAKAQFQHFSLTSEDNWHVIKDGLTTNAWDETTINFTRDAKRNDGSSRGFGEGERMDDFKMFAGRPDEASRYKLLIDDVIFFANDPALPPEPEPFPKRVILLAGFDTGEKDKYWPGDFTIEENPPTGAYWRAAKSVPRPNATPFVRVGIEPPRPVGARTKIRFRYHVNGATSLTVQIFDATVQDNRHVRLENLQTGVWMTKYLDFSRDSRRNDGTQNSSFSAGNLVDDLFFFLEGPNAQAATFYIDEVDAAEEGAAIPVRVTPAVR